jgi:hypothetical protein
MKAFKPRKAFASGFTPKAKISGQALKHENINAI